MNKVLSLIKTCMSDNMNLFRVKTKNQSEKSKKILPIVLFLIIFFYMWSFASMIIEPLVGTGKEFVLLTLFVCFTSIMTLVEGIYKSSSLLFNCKDDNLLLSLPISKSMVLFIRIFKFYVFELMYNSLFLVPAMVVYALNVSVGWTYYLATIVAILLLPIIPIIISCLLGGFISMSSSSFKNKNIAQIIITMAILLLVFYGSFNLQGYIDNLANTATSIHEKITQIYYPAKAYINLATNFNIGEFLLFLGIHIALFALSIVVLSKKYFSVNSRVKSVPTGSHKGDYKIKTNTPMKSLIKKELNRFINSPVFVTNAAFGLAIFLVGCVLISVRFEGIANSFIMEDDTISIQSIESFIPIILFGFICFTSLMSSITSSMISLEAKSFSILKSLPIKPFKIILSKVLTAVLIMIPIILIGDIVMFIRFKFNIFEIIIILLSSIVLPLVAETIGILVNLKYPKMDAENDTEVVKQSMSSMISVFIGMVLTGLTGIGLVVCAFSNIHKDLIILGGLLVYILIYVLLLIHLNRKSVKKFNSINV